MAVVPAAATPLAFADRAAATVAGLRIDPDGHLTEVAVPRRATCWAIAEFTDTARGPADLEVLTLDTDLVAWSGHPGSGVHNPVASVAAAMFGCPGPMHGPVVFTGQNATGAVTDIGVAAVILLAGTAASCDLTDRTAERAAEFARLDIHIAAPPAHLGPVELGGLGAAEVDAEVYDAQRHTVTCDGDWPRCAGCGEITLLGHDDHHPDTCADLTSADTGTEEA